MTHRFPIVSGLLALALGSCTTLESTGDRAVHQLDNVINAYLKAHPDHMFPITRAKLSAFAADHDMPLDLSAVRIITWSTGPRHLVIHYSIATPEVHGRNIELWQGVDVGLRSKDLTNRWSQPLAVVMSTFDFMKQFPMFATLAAASGGSAPSR